MKPTRRHLFALAAISVLIFSAGCSDRNPTDLPAARGNIDPVVFDDAYGTDVYYQGFFQTHYTAVSVDSVYAYGGYSFDGAKSLKFTIPPLGSALGDYTGGVLTSASARDLTDYNALTFYARASEAVTLNLAGLGNDNTGDSLYEAGREEKRGNLGAVVLDEDWTFVVVPIPDSSKLLSERGLLSFAEGMELDELDQPLYPDGYDIWLDEIRYAQLGNIETVWSVMDASLPTYFVGSTVSVTGSYTIYKVDGAPVVLDHSPHYFDFTSTDASVVAVERDEIRVVGPGTATIAATLLGAEVRGKIKVTGYTPPTAAASAPTLPATNVISLFSGVYNDVPVDTWRANWGEGMSTQLQELAIDGDDVKMYTSLNWVGIIFQTRMIDASEMTHFHMDVFAPAGAGFSAQFITFTDAEAGVGSTILTFDETTTPVFRAGEWVSLDIPLADYEFPLEVVDPWTSLGQLVLSSDANLVLVDNVYFHD